MLLDREDYTNAVALGDVNGDSLINVVDIVVCVGVILDNNPNAAALNAVCDKCDWNGDGTVNVVDIVNIVNYILDS